MFNNYIISFFTNVPFMEVHILLFLLTFTISFAIALSYLLNSIEFCIKNIYYHKL